jgi:hypothetical protein
MERLTGKMCDFDQKLFENEEITFVEFYFN